jgi:uroporphyrinogen decarboxylase
MTVKHDMNARERWGLLLIDEEPDRLITYPLVTSRSAIAAGVSVGEYCTDGETMARCHLMAHEEFGADGISLFSDVGILAEAMGSEFTRSEKDVPSLNRPVLGEGDDPARLFPPSADRGRLGVIVKAATLCQQEIGDRVPVFAFVPGPFTTAAMLSGSEEFLTDLVLAPERAFAILDIAARCAVPFFDALMVAGALPLIVEPLASGSVISPDMFRDVVGPRIRWQVDYLHRFDLDVSLHVCGDTEGELCALGETGSDLLSLDEVDLGVAADEVGGKCRLIGNVSPRILLGGSPGDVRKAVEDAVEEGRGNPKGFVLSTGCELPPATPSENLRAFMETAHEIGRG